MFQPVLFSWFDALSLIWDLEGPRLSWRETVGFDVSDVDEYSLCLFCEKFQAVCDVTETLSGQVLLCFQLSVGASVST